MRPSEADLQATREAMHRAREAVTSVDDQLAIFSEHRFAVPEVVKGNAADKPRRKRKRR